MRNLRPGTRPVWILLILLCFTPVLVLAAPSAKIIAYPKKIKGECPTKITFKGRILSGKFRSRKPLIVKYRYVRSDAARSKIYKIRFTKPGKKKIKTTWSLKKSYKGWLAINILTPKKWLSKKARFKVICKK